MPKLTIRATREGLETPVELALQVRTAGLAFVRSSVTGKAVDLAEGQYLVTAQFPGGQEVTEFVDVPNGGDVVQTFDLAHGGSELYRAASGYQSLYLSAVTANPHLAPIRGVTARVRAAVLGAGAAPTWDERDGWPEHKPLPTHLEFAFRSAERKFALVERPGHPPLAVALPGYFLLPATVEFLTDTHTGRLVVKAHPFNRVADWLLGYLRAGTWGGAVALADGLESATELVRRKREDPVAAAVGALVLLRAGRADDLHGWVDLLDNYRPWFPDARIVRAECWARRGDHRAAFNLLAGLPPDVIPMFADALGYALDRLGAYLHRPKRFGIDADLHAASGVLDRLCDLAARSDSTEPLLALEGDGVPALLVSAPDASARSRKGPTTFSFPSPPGAHTMSESANSAHPNPFAGFSPVLGRLPLDRQIEKLQEVGANDQIELLRRGARGDYGSALGVWSEFWRWLTETPAWKHTGMKLGYLAPLDGEPPATREIQDPGVLAPDPTLKGQQLTVTLNRLRAANYPGSGTHRVLFTFTGRNQAAGATEEVAFNLTTRIKESQSAAVLGLPIFVGLRLGGEGLLCTGRIVNVSNDDDERFLAGLESGPFKNGLRLLESLQPAIQPFTALALGVANALGDRNRNQPVYEFNLGLDFATTPGGARLREGLYVVVQAPDEGRDKLAWSDWVYTKDNQIIHKTEPDKVLPLNYFALGIRRSASE